MNRSVFLSILAFTSASIYGMTGFSEYVDNDITPKNTLTKSIKSYSSTEKNSKLIEQYIEQNRKHHEILCFDLPNDNTITRNRKKSKETTDSVAEEENQKTPRMTPVDEKFDEEKNKERNAEEFAKIKGLLERTNAHPDQVTKDDETLMVNAVKNKNFDLVEFLLNNGASPNQESKYGLSLLSLAYINHDWNTMRLLLEHGVNPDKSTILCCSLLFISYIENKLDFMEVMLQCGANPNQRGCFGCDSILIEAIKDKNFETAELLLKYGADPNQTDVFGQTPAFIAIKQRNSKIAKLLFDHGGRLYFFKRN